MQVKKTIELKFFPLEKGKPKQAKYSVQLIFNNFARPHNEEILYELFAKLQAEILLKKSATYIPSLVSLGHICFLMPQKVGKDIKEFMSKTIVKEILLAAHVSNDSVTADTSTSSRRQSKLRLAGQWCENEDELPLGTRAKIEAVKLVVRWCLGLKSECTSIVNVLRILIKLIKDNSSSSSFSLSENGAENVTEAERSRVRATCASQLLKLAQESAFKPLVTAEYFQTLARLIVDPVADVRDILIKKLNRGLKSLKLPIYYMSVFALCGLDTSRDRKSRVKKLYAALIKSLRLSDAKEQLRQKESKDGILKLSFVS